MLQPLFLHTISPPIGHREIYMFRYLPRNMNGIFAVDKPVGVTSYEVVKNLGKLFDKLDVFAHDLAQAKKLKYEQLKAGTKWKEHKIQNRVNRIGTKLGHGGTLDPLALGVLTIGVGTGTKQLNHYLDECTKTYEAKAMLGQSTTTGDLEGEVLTRTETEHVTLEMLKQAAKKFTGKGKQTPPLFSALKVDGMPLYEYARKGLPLPRAIKARDVVIHEFVIHDEFGVDLLFEPRKLETDSDGKTLASMLALNLTLNDSELVFSEEFMSNVGVPESEKVTKIKPRMLAEDAPPRDQLPVFGATATVGSGTYIRSLLSDLGRAVESSAHMVALKRTKQADWEVGVNTFKLSDFMERDEGIWGPVLKIVLENGPKVNVEEEFKKVEEKLGPLIEAERKAKEEAQVREPNDQVTEETEKEGKPEDGEASEDNVEEHTLKKQRVD